MLVQRKWPNGTIPGILYAKGLSSLRFLLILYAKDTQPQRPSRTAGHPML
jgi:hypothetical protein